MTVSDLAPPSDVEEEVFSDASDDEQGAEAPKDVPEGLSYVGRAAYDVMAARHAKYRGVCWNVNSGTVVGEIAQTPPLKYWKSQINEESKYTHSDQFAIHMGELISQGTKFVDFVTLSAPDGKFLDAVKGAIRTLHKSGNEVVVRVLTGNIIGMPTDNKALLEQLTEGLGRWSRIKLWVGSYRKHLSWNHAKIIAVDGKKLFTGGHNNWDPHHLQWNPVRDVSFEVEGTVTQDGHAFVNRMWKYMENRDQRLKARFGRRDRKPWILRSNVSVAKWPRWIDDYPPMYTDIQEPLPLTEAIKYGSVPMVTLGRLGGLHHDTATANPADAAITAMLASAQKSIKLSIQDLGPLTIPFLKGPVPIPGGVWPKEYMRAMGKALFERGVDVHIVLSAPFSIPKDLSSLDANYGNGWTCEDVASEIIKTIKESYPEAEEARLSGLVSVNLKLTYLRSTAGSGDWPENGGKCANHAKCFIVDDRAYYIGSQNLYISDLSEWGILVDDEKQTQKVLEEYWNPMWRQSYELVSEDERDLDVGKVLEGCGIDRQRPPDAEMTDEQWEQILLRKQAAMLGGSENKLCVWLLSASSVRDRDGPGAGSSDSFVRLRLVDGEGNTVGVPQESQVVNDGGANPTWNETFEFEGLKKPSVLTLEVSVYDKDPSHDTAPPPSALCRVLQSCGRCCGFGRVPEVDLGEASFSLDELDKSMMWQHRELTIVDGWLKDSKLKVAFNTCSRWGR